MKTKGLEPLTACSTSLRNLRDSTLASQLPPVSNLLGGPGFSPAERDLVGAASAAEANFACGFVELWTRVSSPQVSRTPQRSARASPELGLHAAAPRYLPRFSATRRRRHSAQTGPRFRSNRPANSRATAGES